MFFSADWRVELRRGIKFSGKAEYAGGLNPGNQLKGKNNQV
jgi:hypothetical protein